MLLCVAVVRCLMSVVCRMSLFVGRCCLLNVSCCCYACNWWLVVVRCLFGVRYSLCVLCWFVVRCLLFVVCLLCVVCVLVVCCAFFAVCCAVFAVRRAVFVVYWCLLSVVCWLVFVIDGCLLCVVCGVVCRLALPFSV